MTKLPSLPITLALLAFAHGQVWAQASANLQSAPVFFTCLAQDPQAADNFWNKHQAPRDKVKEMRQRVTATVENSGWAVCVKRRQWVSKALCLDVFAAYQVEQGLDLRPVMAKYENEIERLKPMFDYFEAAFPQGGVERTDAPTCPEQPEEVR